MATGAVTGLAAEARIARQLGLLAAAGGGTPGGTDAAIASLIQRGVPGLVSFGIAGGLAPNLGSGTLVLPAALRTLDGAGHWVDVEWHGRLARAARAAGIAAVVGGMLGAEKIAATRAEKAMLHAATSAVAVDLESHRVAMAAARARLPFVIVRVIADAADRDLPPAALAPLTRRGRPNLVRVGASLALRPGQLPDLLALGREVRSALEALLRCGRALGPALLRV
jgi:hopanoid-associated phosphorylase